MEFNVSALQFELGRLVDGLNILLSEEYGFVSSFSCATSHEGRMISAFIHPFGWETEDGIYCRLQETENRVSAVGGEVFYRHPDKKVRFCFELDVISCGNFFQVLPRRGDPGSVRLFRRLSRSRR